MTNLVILEKREPVISTLDIAKGVNKDHHTVKVLVKTYSKELETLGTLEFRIQKSKGRPTEFWMLNEQQTTFLITLMRNNDEVIKFKMCLVKEFHRMKKALSDLYIRQNNAEWQEIRCHNKISRKTETDTIKDFIDYAVFQGSQNAQRYYANITKMENKALFLLEQKFDNIRNLLTGQQLMVLSTADQVVEKALKDGMIAEMPYKDIYQMAKERVETFAGVLPKTPVVMLNEIKQLNQI